MLLLASIASLAGPASAYAPHASFYLQSDAALAARAASERWPGDGSPGNPYVIEGYEFVPAIPLPGAVALRTTTLHVVIRNNHFHDGIGNAIYLYKVKNVTIEGNTIERTRSYGVDSIYSDDVTVRGNTIVGATEAGARITGGHRSVITENRIDGARFGILAGDTSSDVSRNAISNPSVFGIWDQTYHSRVTGNRISGAGRDGIAAMSGGSKILDNHVTGSAAFGIGVYSGGYAGGHEIARNAVEGGTVGIRVQTPTPGSVTVTGNSVIDSDAGIVLDQARAVAVHGNELAARDVGLLLAKGRDHLLSGNMVGSSATGIHLFSTQFTTLSGNRIETNRLGLLLNVSEGNLIYDNTFVNERNVGLVGSDDNEWSVAKTPGRNVLGGKFLGGNYWSDYRGADLDDDGLGDIPHGPVPRWSPRTPPAPVVLPEAVSVVAPGAGSLPDLRSDVGQALAAASFEYGPYDRRPLMKERFSNLLPGLPEVIPDV